VNVTERKVMMVTRMLVTLRSPWMELEWKKLTALDI
jgi:hypothetical protein